jgi:methionyl-tRNA formyltransferase
MRILLAGHKERGASCLNALLASGHQMVAALGHYSADGTPGLVGAIARGHGLPWFQPRDLNGDEQLLAVLEQMRPDLTILAGYGPIVNQRVLNMAPLGCLNLHGGKLPQYRGSSPLNWVLIRGESEFTISIIRADCGVDTGDVLAERTFPIGPNDTIADLHEIANREFPVMLTDLVAQMERGPVPARKQDEAQAAYYPLRFPDDGLIVWDLMTAHEIHNRIRALTDPYPGAFTVLNGRRIRLLAARPAKRTYYGEPGCVYLKNQHGLLVCAADRCLWISRATFDGDGSDALPHVARYDRFATARAAVLAPVFAVQA